MERGSRIHMPLDWNHCRRENGANTLRGTATLKVSESLISSRKSSRQIYGKWGSRDGKRLSSAGYSVITAFSLRRGHRCPATFRLVVKWSLVTHRGCSVSLIVHVKMESPLKWAEFSKKEFERNCYPAKHNKTRQKKRHKKKISGTNTNLIAGSLPKGCCMEMRHFVVWLKKIFSFLNPCKKCLKITYAQIRRLNKTCLAQ